MWRFGALAFRYGALYPPRPFGDFGPGSLRSRLARAALRFSVFRLQVGSRVRSSVVERPVFGEGMGSKPIGCSMRIAQG